uniref:Transposase n=1 Tax=Denticeps clupeoides TaxID=299321 RepID=A0AAY4DN58_9TELE
MRTKVIEIYQVSNIKAHLNFAKKHLNDCQDFWENTLWTDETKVELFERCFQTINTQTSNLVHRPLNC